MNPDETAKDTRRLTMGKAEKLRHKTLVDSLFTEGRTLYEYPLRMTYRLLGDDRLEGAFRNGTPPLVGDLQMLVTVPKKKLRHAVDRVRIRRRIREAYRLNRLDLRDAVRASGSVRLVCMAFIYLHAGDTDYAAIEKKMRRLLAKVEKEVIAAGHAGQQS